MNCGYWGQLVTGGEQGGVIRNYKLWSISPPATSVLKAIGFKSSHSWADTELFNTS